jgi:hypothetical protein
LQTQLRRQDNSTLAVNFAFKLSDKPCHLGSVNNFVK